MDEIYVIYVCQDSAGVYVLYVMYFSAGGQSNTQYTGGQPGVLSVMCACIMYVMYFSAGGAVEYTGGHCL